MSQEARKYVDRKGVYKLHYLVKLEQITTTLQCGLYESLETDFTGVILRSYED